MAKSTCRDNLVFALSELCNEGEYKVRPYRVFSSKGIGIAPQRSTAS